MVRLLALVVLCAAVGYIWAQVHDGLMTKWLERAVPSAGDEIVIMSLTLASLTGLALAIGATIAGSGFDAV